MYVHMCKQYFIYMKHMKDKNTKTNHLQLHIQVSNDFSRAVEEMWIHHDKYLMIVFSFIWICILNNSSISAVCCRELFPKATIFCYNKFFKTIRA